MIMPDLTLWRMHKPFFAQHGVMVHWDLHGFGTDYRIGLWTNTLWVQTSRENAWVNTNISANDYNAWRVKHDLPIIDIWDEEVSA